MNSSGGPAPQATALCFNYRCKYKVTHNYKYKYKTEKYKTHLKTMVGCFRRDCEGRKKLPGSCFTTTSGSTFTLTAACKKKGNHCLEKRRSQSEKVKGRIEKVPNELVTISHKREVLKESKSPLKTERYLRIYLFLLHASFWLHFLFHENSLGAHRVRVQI